MLNVSCIKYTKQYTPKRQNSRANFATLLKSRFSSAFLFNLGYLAKQSAFLLSLINILTNPVMAVMFIVGRKITEALHSHLRVQYKCLLLMRFIALKTCECYSELFRDQGFVLFKVVSLGYKTTIEYFRLVVRCIHRLDGYFPPYQNHCPLLPTLHVHPFKPSRLDTAILWSSRAINITGIIILARRVCSPLVA